MNRHDLPRSTTYSGAGRSTRGPSTGTYNSQRPVPPPRTRSAPRQASERIDTLSPPPMTAPGPRGGKPKRLDPFLMRIIVMVDEATEPGISDEEGERKRIQLVNIVLDRGLEKSSMPSPITAITGGQAVAFALRKRLKSEDEVAVLNTLTLVDELMRTCPYFYRFIANEKFFRRLWRFVVPDYKNGVMSMIPIFGKAKIHQGMRGGASEISDRVRILIRAWAEELSVMHNGRYDPDAGFLIERYNNKRSRVSFPDVPRTPLPWVCPIGQGGSSEYLRPGGSSSRRAGSSKEDKITMSLAEVENTVSLFANLVENATSVSDLKEDVCSDMYERCTYIQENLSRMSMNMSKEAELTRAIALSETLEKTLKQYNNSLENGHIVKDVPTVDTISLQSEDEGYEYVDRNNRSSHSLDRYSGHSNSDPRLRVPAPRASRYDEESDHSSGALDGYAARDRAYRSRERSYSPVPVQRKPSVEKRRPSNQATEKRSRRPPAKPSLSRRQKSDSDLPKLAKEKKKTSSASARRKEGLIEIPQDDAGESSEKDQDEVKDGSSILAERYSSQISSRKSKSRSASGTKSANQNEETAVVPVAQQASSPDAAANTSTGSLPPLPALGMNPGAMYHSTGPGMGYNPMMMVPNPYAMYNSVSHVPMPDSMGMYGAYQTVNPAMFYNTVNPQMYATHALHMFPGMQAPSPQATQGAQTTTIQNTPAQSPQLQGMNSPQQISSQNGSVPLQSPLSPSGGQVQVQQPLSNPGLHAVAIPGQPGQGMGMPSQGMGMPSQGVGMPGQPGQGIGMPGQPGQGMGMLGQQMSSFYGSVPGQNPIMAQSSFPFMMQPSPTPTSFSHQGDVSNNGGGVARQLPPPIPQQNEADAQAAVYQSAMQQAAAAYHAAANAYRSVSGQAPIAAPSQPLPGSGSQPPAEQGGSAQGG